VEHYKRREHLVGNLRLVTGIFFLALAWFAAGPHVISGWWLFLPIAVFVVLVAYHEKVRARGRRTQRAAAFYEKGLARAEDRWMSETSRANADRPYIEFDESHPYAVDLDLFGKESLFELLSLARTRSGEHTLATWLKEAAAPAEIVKRQQAVEELRH